MGHLTLEDEKGRACVWAYVERRRRNEMPQVSTYPDLYYLYASLISLCIKNMHQCVCVSFIFMFIRCLSILYFHRNQLNCSHCQLNNITPSLNICVNLSHKFIVKSWMDPLSSTAFQREKSGATLLAFRFAVFMSTCWIISYLANLESAGVLRFLCPSFGQLSS